MGKNSAAGQAREMGSVFGRGEECKPQRARGPARGGDGAEQGVGSSCSVNSTASVCVSADTGAHL